METFKKYIWEILSIIIILIGIGEIVAQNTQINALQATIKQSSTLCTPYIPLINKINNLRVLQKNLSDLKVQENNLGEVEQKTNSGILNIQSSISDFLGN